MLNAIQLMLNSAILIHPTHPLGNGLSSNVSASEPASIDKLMPRQQQVLKRLCEGGSNKRIALNLDLSEHTAKLDVGEVLQALNAENRTQAVIVAKH